MIESNSTTTIYSQRVLLLTCSDSVDTVPRPGQVQRVTVQYRAEDTMNQVTAEDVRVVQLACQVNSTVSNWINYEDLTETQVLAWVNQMLPCASVERELQFNLDNQLRLRREMTEQTQQSTTAMEPVEMTLAIPPWIDPADVDQSMLSSVPQPVKTSLIFPSE